MAKTKQLINPLTLRGYIDPEIHTPKFVIMKKIKLDAKEIKKTFIKLIFFNEK